MIYANIVERVKELNNDAWLSLVERCVRDAEVVGSNPVASTGMKMPKALTIKSFGIFSYVRKRTGKQGKISGHEFSHEFSDR